MTIEDIESLETVCYRCNGTCQVEVPNNYSKKINNFKVSCSTCSGSGKILSDIGRLFFDLLNKYQNIEHKIDDEIEHHVNCYHNGN